MQHTFTPFLNFLETPPLSPKEVIKFLLCGHVRYTVQKNHKPSCFCSWSTGVKERYITWQYHTCIELHTEDVAVTDATSIILL